MPHLGTDVERFINESEALSLCADLCNSLKHLELDRSHSSEPRVFGRKRYHYQLNIGSRSSIKLEWLVERNNKPPIDAFELATDCIAEWDKFLQRLKSPIAGLEQNEYDLALMGRPPDHVPLASEVLSDHPHILIAPAGHRLVGRRKIVAEDPLQETFLAREPGSGTRLLMERFFEMIASGRTIDIVEMGTNETIKQAVMAGLGIAFISAHTCLAELAAGKFVPLSVTEFAAHSAVVSNSPP